VRCCSREQRGRGAQRHGVGTEWLHLEAHPSELGTVGQSSLALQGSKAKTLKEKKRLRRNAPDRELLAEALEMNALMGRMLVDEDDLPLAFAHDVQPMRLAHDP